MLIDTWRRPSMLSPMCQDVARLQFDSCAQKQSLCGTVMMAWIWHVWINAIVFVPAAKAPPKARAKELLYSLDLIHELTSLFSPKVTFAGSLRKAFSQKHISGFLVVVQATAKIRPRPAHGLFSIEKTWYQKLYRTTEAIVPMNDRWRQLNDTMHQYVPLHASMCQHCSLTAVHRSAAFAEQSWFMMAWT